MKTRRKNICIIAAVAANGVIGNKGDIPWRSKSDLARFKRLTMGDPIVMGRKTYASIGRPLPGRMTIVISRDAGKRLAGCEMRNSVQGAIEAGLQRPGKAVWICGGAQIYRQAMETADAMALTHIHEEHRGDSFFPHINPDCWQEIDRQVFMEKPTHDFVWYSSPAK